MAGQEDPVQREIHQDWANREYIEVITSSIKKIADFLNSFGKNLAMAGQLYLTQRLVMLTFIAKLCRSKLANDVDVVDVHGHNQLAR